jgi:dolichyl-phosphate-mannose-protein mannosyltransferase
LPSDGRAPGAPSHGAPAREAALPWLGILVAAQLAIALVAWPVGDFPVNDDWTYAHAVRWLLEEHRLALSSWSTADVLPQTLLGAAVSAAFGYSLQLLRDVTTVVAVGASLAAYACLRAVARHPRDAAVGALVLVAVPCWPVLASSFMSDVYGVLFTAGAAALFLRALQQPGWRIVALAALVAAAGALERQIVAVVPAAYAVACLCDRRRSVRRMVLALAPLAVTLLAVGSYAAYQRSVGEPATQQYVEHRFGAALAAAVRLDPAVWRRAVLNLAAMTGYLGLFCAPWMAWWGMPGSRARVRTAALLLGGVLAGALLATGHLVPFRADNVLDAAGIGPFTLYDAMPRGLAMLDRRPGLVWPVATVVAALGAAGLVALAWTTLRALWRTRDEMAPARRFLAVAVIGYLAPFALTDFFDRYLLAVVPLLLPLWTLAWPAAADRTQASGREPGIDAAPRTPARAWLRARGGRVLAIAWLAAAALLSAMATHDYFAWNRARAAAIAAAERRGATPETLDGGYEYNGYRRLQHGMVARVPGKSWWWVQDDRYIVSFGPVQGYVELAAFPVHRWLARTPPVVRLLERAHNPAR